VDLSNDIFGLHDEAQVVRYKVRDVFTPYRPILSRELLFGRAAEVHAVFKALNTPGRHVFISGERGIGKTSLAIVAAAAVSDAKLIVHSVKRCDSVETFESVLERPLKAQGVNVHEIESTMQSTQTRKIDIAIGDIGLGRGREVAIGATTRRGGQIRSPRRPNTSKPMQASWWWTERMLLPTQRSWTN
jgi:hypothetical protein